MPFGPHHRPQVAQRIDALELGETRLGDQLQRLAGRIGQKVEMELRHRAAVDKAGEIHRASRWMISKKAFANVLRKASTGFQRVNPVRPEPVNPVYKVDDSARVRHWRESQVVGILPRGE